MNGSKDPWNPNSHAYCIGCEHYRSKGSFIYELERDPRMRKCRNLRICYRLYRLLSGADSKNTVRQKSNDRE